MNWKYWSRHPQWEGSRSYILERGDNIEAHCAVIPLLYRKNGRELRAAHFIDWAADDAAIGAGVRILKKVARLTDLTCAVGGSETTRKILPLLGFQPSATVGEYALPVRPFRQARLHQHRDWKLPLRVGRNTLWLLRSRNRLPEGWTAEAAAPGSVPPALWEADGRLSPARQRSPEGVAWYLESPVCPFRLYLACFRGEPKAAFLIGLLPAQARIVDLWSLPDVELQLIYRLAVATSYQVYGVCEVATAASTESRRGALSSCGFHCVDKQAMVTFPALSGESADFDFQSLDNDECFLHSENPVFLS